MFLQEVLLAGDKPKALLSKILSLINLHPVQSLIFWHLRFWLIFKLFFLPPLRDP